MRRALSSFRTRCRQPCAPRRGEWPAVEKKAEYVKIVRDMHGEANEAFARYRSEEGISG